MFAKFKKRSSKLERLDTGDYSPAEYARWQWEMKFIHRIFGERRALRKVLLPKLRQNTQENVSILDVGAGSGELISAIENWKLNLPTFLVGTDLNAKSAKTIQQNNVNAVQSDAFELPFADGSFDYVICSLFLHHLKDSEAVRFLTEIRRVARIQIIVIDLHRSPIAYYFYLLAARVLFQTFTREDGSLSILRSFKLDELKILAGKAGLSDFAVTRSAAFRLVLSGI